LLLKFDTSTCYGIVQELAISSRRRIQEIHVKFIRAVNGHFFRKLIEANNDFDMLWDRPGALQWRTFSTLSNKHSLFASKVRYPLKFQKQVWQSLPEDAFKKSMSNSFEQSTVTSSASLQGQFHEFSEAETLLASMSLRKK
jgi:hypothetical protein